MTIEKHTTYDAFLMIAPGLAKIVAVVGIVATGIFVVLPNLTGTASNLDQTSNPGLIRDYNPMYGKKDSNVTVIEFLDFQCPGCKGLSPVAKQIREEYKNEVRFIDKMFPLPIHANSEISAQSAMAAAKQGKYYEFGEKLFAYQDAPGLSQRTQEQVATELGLNMDQWNKDRKSKEVAQQIAWDKVDGKNAVLPLKEGATETGSVDSTPTLVFMKDNKILYKTNGLSNDEFKANLDKLLGKAPTATSETPISDTPAKTEEAKK
jgi:protein-disulfide isomerase